MRIKGYSDGAYLMLRCPTMLGYHTYCEYPANTIEGLKTVLAYEDKEKASKIPDSCSSENRR
jgi:hypothetical protein